MHAPRHHNPQASGERRNALYDEGCLEYPLVIIKYTYVIPLTNLVVRIRELAIYLVSVMPTKFSCANLSPSAVTTS